MKSNSLSLSILDREIFFKEIEERQNKLSDFDREILKQQLDKILGNRELYLTIK